MFPGRIDVHQHLLPPEYVAALNRHGLSEWAPHSWSATSAIEMMDQHRIATGVLSLSTPGPHLGDDAEGRDIAKKVNEALAELVKDRPDRFGMFASVPLPDIDGTLEAIQYAYDDLKTDGVILLASMQGVYLGDASLEVVMAELERRAAIVLIHPGPLPGGAVPGIFPSIIDFLLDTTRAATNLVLNGVVKRYPHIRFILSHAGGFVPYAAHRIATQSVSVVGNGLTVPSVLDTLSSFYFDTALSASPSALPSLLAFAQPGHVLFGSDWPYCPTETVGYYVEHLDAYESLDRAGHKSINRKNAEALFARLSTIGVDRPSDT